MLFLVFQGARHGTCPKRIATSLEFFWRVRRGWFEADYVSPDYRC